MTRSTAGALAPSGRRSIKFPCGHRGAEDALVRRMRERINAVWVRCPSCNVIALVVQPKTR